ncbi:hypothetical protein D9M70_439720 [compost metagenome]
MLLQHLAHVLRHVRHVVEVGDAAHIEPVPELADTHLDLALGDALLDQRLGHVLAQKADQRRLLRLRCRAHLRRLSDLHPVQNFSGCHARDVLSYGREAVRRAGPEFVLMRELKSVEPSKAANQGAEALKLGRALALFWPGVTRQTL